MATNNPTFAFTGTWTSADTLISFTNLTLEYNLVDTVYSLSKSGSSLAPLIPPTFDYNTLEVVCRFADTIIDSSTGGEGLIYLELKWKPSTYSLKEWDGNYETPGQTYTFQSSDGSPLYSGPALPYIYFPYPPLTNNTISKTISELAGIANNVSNLDFAVFPPLGTLALEWTPINNAFIEVVEGGVITYKSNGTTELTVTIPDPYQIGRYPSINTNRTLTFNLEVTSGGANSNICFVAGTPVKTDQGLIPIEQLDHTVNTIDGQHIVAITKITSTDSYLIRIPKDHLGENAPDTETIISQLHKVLYNGVMTRAKHLPGVSKVDYDGQPLYNVLLDTYGTMIVNNLTVETLHPQANVAVLYKHITTNNLSDVERDKMIKVFNKRLALGDDLRKAFFENIVLIIMLDILLEPKCDVEVTQYSLLKAFVPQCCLVKLVEQPLALC
jgi:hypothetical protein